MRFVRSGVRSVSLRRGPGAWRGLDWTHLMKVAIAAIFLVAPALWIARGRVQSRPPPFPTYSMTDLGTLGGTTLAFGISDTGLIVGTSARADGIGRAFLWKKGAMTDLGTLGGQYSGAYGVNDEGEVVGSAQNSEGEWRAFLWRDGAMHDLGTLGGHYSSARSINSQHEIVGSSILANGKAAHAFLLRGGKLQDLGTLGGAESGATDINDSGVVTGFSEIRPGNHLRHAFKWERGKFVDLGALSGKWSEASSVNAHGLIVGRSETWWRGEVRAFLYDGRRMTNLGTLGVGGMYSESYGINDEGWIVGSASTNRGPVHAFVYHLGDKRDLNDLIGGKGESVLQDAVGVNNKGQIIARGYESITAPFHAFLLTPVTPASPKRHSTGLGTSAVAGT